MRKVIWIIIFGGLFLLSTFFYLNYDCRSYEYGFNSNFCKKEIPYGVKPNIDEYYYFDLVDEDGFELIGKGFRYTTTNFKINRLESYGYKESSILVVCADSLNNIRYLSSYETRYKNSKGNPEISFEELSKPEFEKTKGSYRWVDLDEREIRSLYLKKLLASTGVITSLFLLIWHLLKKERRLSEKSF